MTATLTSVPDVRGLAARRLPATRRAEAGTIWSRAEDSGWSASGFTSWTWTRTWLEHYGDVVDHRFLVAERDGRPCAIALLTHGARGAWRPRTAHVGTAGEPRGSSVFVEHNHLVAEPAERAGFARLVADELAADRRWDRLLMDGMTMSDAHALAGRWPGATVREELCPVTDLDGDGDVLDGLASGPRRRARATLRAFGELEVEWASDEAQARDVFDELVTLHQRHWIDHGEPGAFADERFTAFHRAYVQRAVPRREAALLRVRRGDETVACLYGLIDDRRLLFYQGGLRGYDDNRLRSGLAAHLLFMRACATRGLTEYDFLAPATRYKLELATGSRPLAWVEIERHRWRTRTAQATRRLRSAR
ncbi:MAG: hypothetical protein JWP17_790 [Solirubrobacterales bacterium]|nr:hypothetical protein [Solirubrobacterales bacterium]